MRATGIPDEARLKVQLRQRSRCARCGIMTVHGHWHHRRSRSVRDELTHSPANGILVCQNCHAWIHAHPEESRSKGWIVSRHLSPLAMPVETPMGWMVLLDDGTWYPAR